MNLTVINVAVETTLALAALAQRDLDLSCTIQDGQMWMGEGEKRVEVKLTVVFQGRT